MYPEDNNSRVRILEEHPTGLATAVATIAVFIAVKIGLELDPEEAVVIPGAIAVIVSYFTPRLRKS